MDAAVTENIRKILFDALAEDKGFEYIIDAVCGKYGVVFAIINLSNQFVVRSHGARQSGGDAQPLSRLSFEGDAGVGEKIIAAITANGTTLFSPGEINGAYQICCSTQISDAVEGIVLVQYSNKEDGELAQAVLEELTRVYSYFCNRKVHHLSSLKDIKKANLAKLLFADKGGSSVLQEAVFGAYTKGENMLSPNYVILCIRSETSLSSPSVLEGVAHDFSSRFPYSYYLLKDWELFIILHSLEAPDYVADSGTCRSIREIAGKYGVICGVSMPFFNISDRSCYKNQAKLACACGRDGTRTDNVFFCEKRFSEVLLSAAVSEYGDEMFILSDIEKLNAYDKENGTSYLDTLEAYLRSGNRITSASKELFMDRSTVKYRLNKIKDILHRDFELPEVAGPLRLSIELFRLVQHRNN